MYKQTLSSGTGDSGAKLRGHGVRPAVMSAVAFPSSTPACSALSGRVDQIHKVAQNSLATACDSAGNPVI
jgi:hypothetical protein